MKAEEARELRDKHLHISGHFYVAVFDAIKKAAEAGSSSVSIESLLEAHVNYSMRRKVKDKLSSMGYKIDQGDCQRGGSWFTVRW